MPAETLGKKYVVTVPSSPNKTGAPLPVPAHMVRWVGNVNDTHLAYDPPIAGAPATLQAGEVVTLPQVDTNFQVTGDQPFLVQTVMLEADVIDAASSAASRKGDPSLSFAVATEQYRKKYLFLAPDDYAVNYVDVVKPTSAILTLDGKPVTATAVPIGTSGFGLVRIRLSSNAGGVHVLNADQQIGIQVLGYGEKTSYQYPGGINLRQISPVIM